jgi:hypothetical protein
MLRLSEGWVAVDALIPPDRVDSMTEANARRIANIAGITGDRIVNQIAVNPGDVLRVCTELNLIEEVEEFHPELQIDTFANLEIFM